MTGICGRSKALAATVNELRQLTGITRVKRGIFRKCSHHIPAGKLLLKERCSVGVMLHGYTETGIKIIYLFFVPSQENKVLRAINKFAPPLPKSR